MPLLLTGHLVVALVMVVGLAVVVALVVGHVTTIGTVRVGGDGVDRVCL